MEKQPSVWLLTRAFFPIASELLLAGAAVDAADKIEFQTGLHRACMHGFLDLVKLLLDNGANIECRDRTQTTPLLHACWNKQLKVCSYLIKRGAQWNVKNTQGLSPLDIAMQVSRGDLIFIFNNFRKKLLRNRVEDLEKVAKLRNLAGVQEILGNSVDCIHTYPEPFRRAHDELLRVMENQGRGCTPAEYKIVRGIHELFVASRSLLFKEFATLQLIEWIRKGDARLVDRYMDTQSGSIDLNAHTGREGTTPLIVAAEVNNTDIVKLLLKYGARPNVPNKFTCFTALMAAAKNSNIDMIKVLLKSGSDPLTIELIGGKTASRYAGNHKCLKLLDEYEKDIQKIKDNDRRERELAIYSQELGIPLDWFAMKRKDKLDAVTKAHQSETKAKLLRIGNERKRKLGLHVEGDTERSGVSAMSEFTDRDGDAASRGSSSDSEMSFTSGSSYSYHKDDDADTHGTDEDSERSGEEEAAEAEAD